MERPNQPSVSPSEPEIKRRTAESAMQDAKNGEFDGVQVYLPYVKEFLKEYGLDVDSKGFVINRDTGEYAVPYVFVDELVKEYVKGEDESIFDAFFRPVTDDRVYGWDNQRLHLSDVHSVIETEDGSSHPIRDGYFDVAELHARLETGFRLMMSWSDIVKKEDIDDSGRWLGIAKESDEDLELSCMNLDCGHTGVLSGWNGNEHSSPECPECGGDWDSDGITVCTICENWYWGTYFAGEGMYAEPACANCGADMEYLERVSRYDDLNSFDELVRENQPECSVFGLNNEGDIVYTFDHTETWDEAVEEKQFAENIAGGSAFDEVETVAIHERNDLDTVNHHEREDERAED